MQVEAETEEIEVRLLLEAIAAKYGYDLRDYQRPSITRRVRAALARSGASSLGELQHRLLHDAAVFASVLHDLTVQVSDMFRDPSFYAAFRRDVVPVLRTYPQLKVWHAGCSSGEEVYATAIVLMEEGLYDRTQIYATDLSGRALERAQEGIYSAARLSSFAANYIRAGGTGSFAGYVSTAYDHVAVNRSLGRHVVFFHHDLVSDRVFGEMNVVLCRNVLIYFGPELRARVTAKLRASLCHGGFLCLGASERLGPEAEPGLVEAVGGEPIYRAQSGR